eukprot:756561-Rhodomonas_salina.1
MGRHMRGERDPDMGHWMACGAEEVQCEIKDEILPLPVQSVPAVWFFAFDFALSAICLRACRVLA